MTTQKNSFRFKAKCEIGEYSIAANNVKDFQAALLSVTQHFATINKAFPAYQVSSYRKDEILKEGF